tara:strand:+ start:287 stop:460 length:174 start_codon:yes stop_codon:yes gene_type:complete
MKLKLNSKKNHTQVEAERVKMQKAYDNETNHGMLPEEQKRWQKEVNQALELLAEFSS